MAVKNKPKHERRRYQPEIELELTSRRTMIRAALKREVTRRDKLTLYAKPGCTLHWSVVIKVREWRDQRIVYLRKELFDAGNAVLAYTQGRAAGRRADDAGY